MSRAHLFFQAFLAHLQLRWVSGSPSQFRCWSPTHSSSSCIRWWPCPIVLVGLPSSWYVASLRVTGS